MEYEKLLIESDQEGLIVKDKPLLSANGRIHKNRIALRSGLSTIEKTCTLAEELGHHYTTVGSILDQSDIANRKQELHARVWGYNKLIGLTGIIECHRAGCLNLYEMAAHLDVTEEYLSDAIKCYKGKYGLYKHVDNYLVFFEPLGVLELYK